MTAAQRSSQLCCQIYHCSAYLQWTPFLRATSTLSIARGPAGLHQAVQVHCSNLEGMANHKHKPLAETLALLLCL